MRAPRNAGASTADINGNGVFNLFVPASFIGLTVVFQAIEQGSVSNVAGTYIE